MPRPLDSVPVFRARVVDVGLFLSIRAIEREAAALERAVAAEGLALDGPISITNMAGANVVALILLATCYRPIWARPASRADEEGITAMKAFSEKPRRWYVRYTVRRVARSMARSIERDLVASVTSNILAPGGLPPDGAGDTREYALPSGIGLLKDSELERLRRIEEVLKTRVLNQRADDVRWRADAASLER